ncbi:hypothetical protein BLA18110_07749 [Burkholderia lata]|uniref:antiviral reverse transcriptase Drt4 n=1 Tax=Burkholderia lata (strain ATCC 17760 / DSM 23089 / LMG 22485 / NCIMB 9086 / R18194 / 383) TaxID=482957 RepID=UPI001453E59F|nr:antiviral reverse transcriptase Drt4 [Burkholderia lata]VWD52225.1 hypothetical protein BLA18110_07749 [Burkholderia lata]
MPIIQHRHIYEGLTRWNYFPNQKAPVGELPPSVSTRQFTPEVAALVASYEEPRGRRGFRYDDVSYLMTRHNNVPRELALIHPRPYARLASKIWEHWDELGALTDSENSAIKPEQHQDGRMFIMNYEDAQTRTATALETSFAKRFRVETDIAGCFHSIYSHSIPWATVGFEIEKARVRDNGPQHWSNELDSLQMVARRGETVGLAIGPGTSSILVELILGRVDDKLRQAGFVFRRYIDDYIGYCETHEKANEFLTILGAELAAYRLRLNLQKTTIVALPEPLVEPWVVALGSELNSRVARSDDGTTRIFVSDAIQYLDFATRLNNETRDGSVLKYAVGSLLPHLDDDGLSSVANYLVNLSWHYPALLPYLEFLVQDERELLAPYSEHISAIIVENAKHRRSDGMAWPLHLAKRANIRLSPEAIASVIASRDCVACTLLFELHQADDAVTGFAREVLNSGYHERDQQWLLLYQLYYHETIQRPDDELSFDILRQHNVNFIPTDSKLTDAEEYCQYIDNPFRDDIEPILTLPEWVAERNQQNAAHAQARDPLQE